MKPILFAYNGCASRCAEAGELDALLAYPEVVAGGGGYADLRQHLRPHQLEELEPKLYRYIDFWGASYPHQAGAGVHRWCPGPQDVYPGVEVRSSQGPYPYVQDRHQWRRWLGWAWSIISAYPKQRGLFFDDWTGNVNWWRLTPEEVARVWPEWQAGDWMQEVLEEVEQYARALAGLRGQQIIVNGRARRSGPRLWESLGKWCSLAELQAVALPGDVVLVKGIKADGVSWATTYRPEGGYPAGTSFKQVFSEAYQVAQLEGLRLALCYEDRPEAGGSTLSWHSYSNPARWAELVT